MALNLSAIAQFIGRISAPDASYPFGSALNESAAGAGDGTPYIKLRADDVFGFQQSLLNAANVTPNNNPDSVTNPQYLGAFAKIGWTQYVKYEVGARTIRNDREYVALSASGPGNGGAVDPAIPDNGVWLPVRKKSGNLIGNAKAAPIVTVDGTPRTITAGTEVADGWFVDTDLVDVTYVDGEYNATSGTMYYDVEKTNGLGDVALSSLIASAADISGVPVVAGVTVTDETTAWRVTVDLAAAPGVFSVQLERDDVPTMHDLRQVASIGGSGVTAQERIGQPFAVFDHLTGADAPDNSGDAKYVKLTAGLDGAGQFNAGLLTNETTTGSGPTVEITAEIATGSMSGQVINLVNSENRHIAPGENSGTTHNDQMQQITGSVDRALGVFGSAGSEAGAMSSSAGGNLARDSTPGTSTAIEFDSANSPGARTGDKTDVKRVEATYYMRIV